MKSKLYLIKDWTQWFKQSHWHSAELAKTLGTSESTLRRVFHEKFHAAPQERIDIERGKEAKRMLLNGYSEKEIIEELGFKRIQHFSRFFRRLYHKCPRQFLNHCPRNRRYGGKR